MVKAKRAGADGGNGSLKMWVEGSEKGILIPSITSEVLTVKDTKGLDMPTISIDDLENHLDVTFRTTPALKKTNTRYLLGQVIMNKKLNASANEMALDSRKYSNEMTAQLILVGLMVDAMRSNPEKSKIKATYDIAVALPLLDLSKEKYDLHTKRFIGTHELIFHHPNGDEVEVTITIECAICLPEGAIGSFSIVHDEKGNYNKYQIRYNSKSELIETTFEKMPLLLVDIGSGTTELAASTGINFNHDLSKGLKFGGKTVINEIMDAWNADPNNGLDPIRSTIEFTDAYTDALNYLHNRVIECSEDFINKYTNSLANEITNLYEKMGSSQTRIIIYGGGQLLFKKPLNSKLGEVDLADKTIFLPNPIFTNAKGLLNYTMTPAFKARKEKFVGVTSGEK